MNQLMKQSMNKLVKQPMNQSVDISIIIIFDQFRQEKLERLLQGIKAQDYQGKKEIILIHESDEPRECPKLLIPVRYVTIPAKRGIPFNRNQGINKARGDIIVFIDDDCWVHETWLSSLIAPLDDKAISVITSGTKIPPSNFLGNSIAALGFPGGGTLGFEKVWRVSPQGFTNHLAVGNCALRRTLFDKVGFFDESLTFGAEDAELSHRLEKADIPIKYIPQAYAFHEARTTWKSFVRWQLRRGRANYHFKKKVGGVGSFVKLRLWSAKNIMKQNCNIRLPFILFLLSASFTLQQLGYLTERWRYG